MSDDLEELARASNQVQRQPIRVYARPAYSPAPAPAPKTHSPFAWGFFVALGVMAAGFVVTVALFSYGAWQAGLTAASAPQNVAPPAASVEPVPPPRAEDAAEERSLMLSRIESALEFTADYGSRGMSLNVTNASHLTVRGLRLGVTLDGRIERQVGTDALLPGEVRQLAVPYSFGAKSSAVRVLDGEIE